MFHKHTSSLLIYSMIACKGITKTIKARHPKSYHDGELHIQSMHGTDTGANYHHIHDENVTNSSSTRVSVIL